MSQKANVGMYSSRYHHKNAVEGNAYITVGDPCKSRLLGLFGYKVGLGFV
jgi:hypothetical protein